MDIIAELKVASVEVARLRTLIEEEMDDKAKQCKLWQNGMCAAWGDYVKAIEAQNKVRNKHGV